MRYEEGDPAIRRKTHENWDPSWNEGRFCGFLKCDYIGCGELSSISGETIDDVDFEEDEEGVPQQIWATFFLIRSISPAPVPFRAIDNTPASIQKSINIASSLLWQSDEAAANSLRHAVEHLMDYQKVVKTGINKKGKRHRLTLHARIERFREKDPHNGSILLAVKWIGNSGSHPIGLSRDDLLDAFEMMEHVLDNLYGTTRLDIFKKAKQINRRKGPTK